MTPLTLDADVLARAAAFMLNLVDQYYGTDHEFDIPEEAEFRAYRAIIEVAAIEAEAAQSKGLDVAAMQAALVAVIERLDVEHPDCGDRCACYVRGVDDEAEASSD